MRLVECVPNFSEGRRKDVIDAIVAEATSRNVKVLDIESDPDHNRSVLTFVGEPAAVVEAALAVSGKAIELIDLNKHTGQHPRMGAVDVVPFIPISDISMDECVRIAKEFAKKFSDRFKVPVFLYEGAATRPDRKDLADVRKGEFEGLREEIGKNPDKIPDYGPNAIHPTAGATAVGARQILIAYNVNLATDKLEVAKMIAKHVRAKAGGLAAVKALGFELKDRGIVQVSMNMVDYKTTPLFRAFELVSALAKQEGVEVLESEIVGLAPMEALTDTAEFYLKLIAFKKDQILERRLGDTKGTKLIELSLARFASDVASEKPVPGGGSVSAYAGSLAASLVCMVARLTLKRPELQKHWGKAREILDQCEVLQRRLLSLVDEDAESFTALMQAYRLPKESGGEKQKRTEEIQTRLKRAAEVPLNTAEQTAKILSEAKNLAEVGNENALSDLQTATYLAHASVQGAISNVRINLAGIKDINYREQTAIKIGSLQEQVERNRLEALSFLAKRAKNP